MKPFNKLFTDLKRQKATVFQMGYQVWLHYLKLEENRMCGQMREARIQTHASIYEMKTAATSASARDQFSVNGYTRRCFRKNSSHVT